MTRVVIAGAAGRMGKALIRCAMDAPDIVLAGATEATGRPEIGQDAGTMAGLDPCGVAVADSLADVLSDADAVIDFTFHTAVPDNIRIAHKRRRAVVIGTTALDAAETDAVMKASADIPILWAPNMSLGMNLLFATVRRAAQVLGSEYLIELDETHHVHKVDAPSGTALRLGEKAADGRGLDFAQSMVHDEDGSRSPEPGKVVVHSHREGEVVGDHTVRFVTPAETVEFTHHAYSRDCFALGALKAAQWVVTQRPRLYDMQDMLGLQ